MAQFARPDSDITVNGWTSSVGGNLYPTIDEVTASDSDYISSQDNTNNAYVAGLSNVDDPNIHTGHIVRYRYRKDAAGGHSIDFQVELRQGETVIATGTQHVNIGTGWTAGSFTLTEGEAGNITDYTDLRLYLRRLGDTGGPPGNRRMAECSWAELEVPDVVYVPPTKTIDWVGQAPKVNEADIVTGFTDTADAAGATIDLTDSGLGVTPKAALVVVQRNQTDGTITHSVGLVTASGEQHCVFTKSVAGATTDENSGAFNDAVGFADDGTNQAYYKFNSWISNGIRLNRTNSGSDPASYRFMVWFFGGTDLNDAEVIEQALDGFPPVAYSIPTVVDAPNAAFVLAYNTREAATTSPTYRAHSQKSIGFMVKDGAGVEQATRFSWFQNGVTSGNSEGSLQVDRIGRSRDGAGSHWSVEGNSFQPNAVNVTLQNANPNGSDGFVALLVLRLNTDDLRVYDAAFATSTGDDAHTEPGFRPYNLFRSTTRQTAALQTGVAVQTSSTSEGHHLQMNANQAPDGPPGTILAGIVSWWHGDHGATGGQIGTRVRTDKEFIVTENEAQVDERIGGQLKSIEATGHTFDIEVNSFSEAAKYIEMAWGLRKIAAPNFIDIAVPTKTIDWVGQVPTVNVGAGGTVVIPPTKTIDWVGQVPVLDLGIIPPELQIDWVGQVPALDLGINVPEKQIDWVGQVPVLDFAILVPEKQIDWVGDDPAVIEQQPTPLAIDWVGQVPTASIGVRVMVPELQIDWVGRDPFPAVHNPQTELVIDWVGQAPVLDLGIIPPELTIDWVGQTPEPVVSIPTLTIDWVGQTPTVIEAQTELVIDWVGQVPTVLEGADTIIQIPTQTIDWVGRAPVLDLGIIPPELTIDWVGQTPALDLGIIPPELVLTFANSDPFPAVHNPIPEQQIDWVGQVPTVQEGAATVVAVPLQTFDWVGIDPGVIEPQAAPLALSVGLQAPVLDFGISIPERALDWVGQTVGTFAYIPAHPGISITHRTPDLPVPIPTLTIDWLGIEPGIPLVPPAKTLDWVGYAPAPAVSNNIRASPPELTIDWAGYAPLAGMLGSINVLVPEQQIALAHQIALVEFFSLGGLGIDDIELVPVLAFMVELLEAVGIDRIELAPVIDLEEVEQL